MKILLGGLIVLSLVWLGLWFWLTPNSESPEQNATAKTTNVTNEAFGISFDYPNTPVNYTLTETARNVTETTTFLYRYTLMPTTDYEALALAPDGTEAPPAITISIYENPTQQSAQQWGSAMANYANLNLIQGEQREGIVGEKTASTYKADGLYPSDNYLVTEGSLVYHISGQYNSPEDQIVNDFASVVESIEFLPPTLAE